MADDRNERAPVGVEEQVDAKTVPPPVTIHVHYHEQTVIGGVVINGNLVQPTEVNSTNIGSIQVNAPPIIGPPTLSQGPSNAPLASAFLSFMRALNLPQQTEAALHNNDLQTYHQEHGREPDSDSSGVKILPADIINQLEKIELDDSIEAGMKDGFEALIRDDETEKSTMDFIQRYNKEENGIPTEDKGEWKGLEPLVERVWKNIYMKLMIATCERHLEDGSYLKQAMSKICLHLATTIMMKRGKIEQILLSSLKKTRDKTLETETMLALTHSPTSVRAIVAWYAIAKLHAIADTGVRSMHGIIICAHRSAENLYRLRAQESNFQFHKKHLIPLLEEVIDYLKTITGLAKERRTEVEAWRFLYNGLCLHLCFENDEAAKLWKSGIDLMKREFKEDAETLSVYGRCLANYALYHSEKGDVDGCRRAIDLCKRSIQAFEKAGDWVNNEEKARFVGFAKSSLVKFYERQQKLESG